MNTAPVALVIALAAAAAAAERNLAPGPNYGYESGMIREAGLKTSAAATDDYSTSSGGARRSRDAPTAADGHHGALDADRIPDQLLQRVTSPVRYGVGRPLPPLETPMHYFYMLGIPKSAVTMSATTNNDSYDALLCLSLADYTRQSNGSVHVNLRTLDISSTMEQTWPAEGHKWQVDGETWRTHSVVSFTNMSRSCTEYKYASLHFYPELTVGPSRRHMFIFGLGALAECAELFMWSNAEGLRHVPTIGGDRVPHLFHSLTSQPVDGDGGVRLVAFGGKLCLHANGSEVDGCVDRANGTNSLWQLEVPTGSTNMPTGTWQRLDIAPGSEEPSRRFSADVFAVNASALLMYGGFQQGTGYSAYPLCDLWLFDGAVPGVWRQLGNLTVDCTLRASCILDGPVAIKQLAAFIASSSTLVVVTVLCRSSAYTVFTFDIDNNPAGEWQATEMSTLFGDKTFFFFREVRGSLTMLALVSTSNGSLYLVDSTGNSMHRLVFDLSPAGNVLPSPANTSTPIRTALLSVGGEQSDRFIGNWGCVTSPPVTLPPLSASQVNTDGVLGRTPTFLLGGMCGDGFSDLRSEETSVMHVWTMEVSGRVPPVSSVYYTKTVPKSGPRFGRRMGHTAVYQVDAGTEMIAMFGGGLARSVEDYSYELAPVDLWCFDIRHYVWVTSKIEGSTPGARMFHVAFAITNTSFALYGGSDQQGDAFHATNDFWLFAFDDLANCSGKWTNLTGTAEPTLPPLYGHTATMFRGEHLIYGGGNGNGYGRVSSDLLFAINITATGSISWTPLSFDFAGRPPGRRFHVMYPYTEDMLLAIGNDYVAGNPPAPYSTAVLFVFNSDDMFSTAAITAVPFFNWPVTPFMQVVGGYLLGGRTAFNDVLGEAEQHGVVYGNQYAILDFGLCPLGKGSVLPFLSSSAAAESSACRQCPADTYSSVLVGQCTPCVPGTRTNDSGGATDVSACFVPDACVPDPCNGRGSCKLESGRAVCYCNLGYMSQTQCYLPVYFIIVGSVAMIVIVVIVAVARKYRSSHRRANEQARELRASHVKIWELTRVWEVQWKQLSVCKKVAAGSFGEVWLAEFNDMLVAVKKLSNCSRSEPDSIQDFRHEVELMQTIRHRNIVFFLGAGKSPSGEMFIVMEYLKRGALLGLLHDKQLPLDLSDQLRFALDAARGMAFLHGLPRPRIHRDLTSSNLLVSDKWVVKVADFGTARLVETLDQSQAVIVQEFRAGGGRGPGGASVDERSPLLQQAGPLYARTRAGPTFWKSPEMMMGMEHGASTDVYSFGIVLYEIFFRVAPYEERKDFRFYCTLRDSVVSGYRPVLSPHAGESDVPETVTDLMQHCWEENPTKRPTFEEIVGRLVKLSVV